MSFTSFIVGVASASAFFWYGPYKDHVRIQQTTQLFGKCSNCSKSTVIEKTDKFFFKNDIAYEYWLKTKKPHFENYHIDKKSLSDPAF